MRRPIPYAPILVLSLLIVGDVAAQLDYRPGREFRSLNTDTYEIAVQRNGRLDVALSSGEPVFLNAFPMIWFDGEEKPEALPVDGRLSGRIDVADPLGQGNGMLLHQQECRWSLRAYPGRPFFAVQVAYENQSKKPQRIRALLPWCVGEPRRGGVLLGAGTTQSVQRQSVIALPHSAPSGESLGIRHVAIFNPASGRSLILGALTHRAHSVRFELDSVKERKDGAYDHFRAIATFDPPLVLEPGESVESDVFYVGVAEPDPVLGLERFIRAVQVVNGYRSEDTVPAHRWLPDAALPPDPIARVRSPATRPPRPVDLFQRERPNVWVDARLRVVNWADEAAAIPVSLGQAGFRPDTAYHLFDPETESYLGIARTSLTVELEPQSVRTFTLTPATGRPVLLGAAHESDKSPRAQWDGSALRGQIESLRAGQQRLWIAVPPDYAARAAEPPSAQLETSDDGRSLTLTLPIPRDEEIEWAISFDRSR